MRLSDCRRIVVTGATGFLGGAVARHFARLARNAEVIGLGRDEAKGASLVNAEVRFVRMDLADAVALAALVKDADLVVHAAALSSPWGRRADFVAANVTATQHLLQGCLAGGVRRLVHLSSPSVYHTGTPRFGVREDDPLPPRGANQYAATKREADEFLLAAWRDRKLPVVLLRPRAVFGPGDNAVFPRLIRPLREGKLRRLGAGDSVVDLTYIDNAVDAIRLAAEAPPACDGRIYNLSNGEPVRIWSVIDRLADRLGVPRPTGQVSPRLARALASAVEGAYAILRPGKEPPLSRYAVELLTASMTLDISRARAELGYAPAISLEEGLARTFAALGPPEG